MRRILCIWFPQWPLQRLQAAERLGVDQPLVLYAEEPRRGLCVTAASRLARAAGVRPGQPLAEARALLDAVTQGAASAKASRARRQPPAASVPAPTQSAPRQVSERSSSAAPPSGVLLRQADPAADREALRQLAWSAQRFSPLVGLDDLGQPSAVPGDSLLIDLTGCEHFWPSERQFAAAILDDLARQGWRVQGAVASTVGAAWGVAHGLRSRRPVQPPAATPVHSTTHASVPTAGLTATAITTAAPAPDATPAGTGERGAVSPLWLVPPGRERAWLGRLSVRNLRLSNPQIDLLQKLGVLSIEQLLALPRPSLPARFGSTLLPRIEQALGERYEAVVPERLQQPIIARWAEDDPLTSRPHLEVVCEQLLEELVRALGFHQSGLQELRCQLTPVGQPPLAFDLRMLRPLREVRYLADLLKLQFDRQPLPREVAVVQCEVLRAGPLVRRQADLFGGDLRPREAVPELLERLTSRLGDDAVRRPVVVPDPQPEYAWTGASPALPHTNHSGRDLLPRASATVASPRLWDEPATQNEPAPRQFLGPLRPVRLLTPPQPIEVISIAPDGPPQRLRREGQSLSLVHVAGPERIETGWWRDEDIQRDYYRAQTQQGELLWIYRCRRTSRWFWHGSFD